MKIFIYATESQQREIIKKDSKKDILFTFSTSFPLSREINEHDAFFLLDGEPDKIDLSNFGSKPVVINAVSEKLSDFTSLENVARINGWPGFLQREVWETASPGKETFSALFQNLGWEIIPVKDEPGLVSARVISMIINEAFYALKEKISTKDEIDTAMKSGTNYPFGPFEWAEKIGIEKIFDLLSILSINDERCIPSFKRNGQVE